MQGPAGVRPATTRRGRDSNPWTRTRVLADPLQNRRPSPLGPPSLRMRQDLSLTLALSGTVPPAGVGGRTTSGGARSEGPAPAPPRRAQCARRASPRRCGAVVRAAGGGPVAQVSARARPAPRGPVSAASVERPGRQRRARGHGRLAREGLRGNAAGPGTGTGTGPRREQRPGGCGGAGAAGRGAARRRPGLGARRCPGVRRLCLPELWGSRGAPGRVPLGHHSRRCDRHPCPGSGPRQDNYQEMLQERIFCFLKKKKKKDGAYFLSVLPFSRIGEEILLNKLLFYPFF